MFPQGIPCQSLGRDTICINPHNSTSYKILLYVDSAGCSSCRLKQLVEWKHIIADADSLYAGEVDFLFFFQPKKRDEQELQSILRNNGFSPPVFIDTNNEIDKLNTFPSQPDYQCFLLDRENNVLLVGNPSYSTSIWQLFKRYIAERDSKLTSGKKEKESYANKTMTLPLAFPSNKKGGCKNSKLV